jgi:hypothetical protein
VTTHLPSTYSLSTIKWHQRFGHASLPILHQMAQKNLVISLAEAIQNITLCESYLVGKQHCQSFPTQSTKRATNFLELVHFDLCGPMQSLSLGLAKYFVSFIDDFSQFSMVYFIKAKSETLQNFQIYKTFVEKQTGH